MPFPLRLEIERGSPAPPQGVWPGLTRRDFLRGSGIGLVGLTLAAAALPACSPARPAPSDLRILGPLEFGTLAAAAERIADGLPLPEGGDGLARAVDESFAAVAPWMRTGFRDALRFLEFTPLFLHFPPARFSTSSPATRDRILEAMATSRIRLRRQVYTAIKQAVLFTAYGDPTAWAAVGYDGPGPAFGQRAGKPT
jgi:hypothetical protein